MGKRKRAAGGSSRKKSRGGGASDFIGAVPRTLGAPLLTERKYIQYHVENETILAASDWSNAVIDPDTVNCLFAPAQGTGISGRIGRKVKLVKITIRGAVHQASKENAAVLDNDSLYRMILVLDKQTNATQMTGDLLMSGGANAMDAVCNFQNTANFGRFQVLKDITKEFYQPHFEVTAAGTGPTYQDTVYGVGAQVQKFKMSYKWKKGLDVHFNAAGGSSVADIVDNSLHFLITASNVALPKSLYYTCRCVYLDA